VFSAADFACGVKRRELIDFIEPVSVIAAPLACGQVGRLAWRVQLEMGDGGRPCRELKLCLVCVMGNMLNDGEYCCVVSLVELTVGTEFRSSANAEA
jgi:hypothetical protein